MNRTHRCTGEDCRYCQALIEWTEQNREQQEADEREELDYDSWPGFDR